MSFWSVLDARANQTRVRLFETGLLVVLLFILFGPAWKSLFYAWEIKPQVSHGYLVLPISLWLCWRRGALWANVLQKGSPAGYLLLLPGLLLYLFGTVIRADTLIYAALMLSIAGVVVTMLGGAVLRAYLFPFLFLVFMFPIPDSLYLSLTNPLKLLVSRVSTDLILIIGIPAYQNGNIIQFANMSLEVIEACSGIRSLLSYLMLSMLLASFSQRKQWSRTILILSAFPLALFINVVRISGTGILAHSYGKLAANTFFHEFAGLVTFAIGFLLLLGIYSLLGPTSPNKHVPRQ